jgi:simple sugar transport system permease protein
MIRFEPRAGLSPLRSVGLRILAVAAALAIAAIPLSVAGAPILPAYAAMIQGAAGTVFALTETLTRATPLIFTGLAAAVAFRARLFNIGAEGQLYLGALATIAVGSGAVEGPPALLVPLVLLAAAAAGAALMLGPTILKVRFGVDEVVTTLLLNFVVLLFVQMMLEGPFKDPMGGGWPQSEPILPEAALPPLLERMRLHAGLPIGIALCVLAHILISRTVLGCASGPSARTRPPRPMRAFRCSGPAHRRRHVGRACRARGGLRGRRAQGQSHGRPVARLRLCGIVVAMIAGLQPLAVIPAALLLRASSSEPTR